MAITIDGTNGLTTDNGALKLDGTTLVVDDTNNRVGIGTASPAVALDVSGYARASSGILFGTDTAAANALDDYEEGTWTPQLGSDGTQPTVTYTGQIGTYTKIGNRVFIECNLSWSSFSGGTGSATIKNLPFASGYSSTDSRPFMYMFAWGGISFTGQLAIVPDISGTASSIYYNNNGAIGSQTIANMNASGGNLRFFWSYIVNY